MNKSAIQKFAIQARRDLIEQVKQRAYQYGVNQDGYGDADADTVNGRVLTPVEKSQRQELIRLIQDKGYDQVMEEVAYTWFNRFVALRFMEVNNYLPTHIRVFSDASGAFKPEILSDVLYLELEGLSRERVSEYLEQNDDEGLYRYLLLTQCNALSDCLPRMFEPMGSYTELLLPNNILRLDSVLGHMVSDIPEEDWQDAVQIIGWMYQYYNTELKDDTFAKLKKNIKITKERIPAATQLFTPDWIVRYMVENSLGRIFINSRLSCAAGSDQWTEAQRIEQEKELAAQMGWKYYLPEAEQTPAVRAQLRSGQCLVVSGQSLTELKVIDPCMGSGHILVYAFDVLMQIYTASGWNQREAAQSILKNNLYGLDIDDRAAQLAYFAVMMKARQYDRRLFSRGIQPNVMAIRASNGIPDMAISYFHQGDPALMEPIRRIVQELQDAKEYGSILEVQPEDWTALYQRFDEIFDDIDMMRKVALEELLPLVKCAEWMAQKYDVVVTNPPYMGSSGMNELLAKYVKDNYPDEKADLFSCFIEHGNQMVKPHGYNCMVTMQSWMFLSSFEKMRENTLHARTITNLMHMENMVMGIAFGTAVTVFRNDHINGYKGTYNQIKLKDIENEKPREFPVRGNRFAQTSTNNFSKIPGSPVAYWVSDALLRCYENGTPLGQIAAPRKGNSTSDNNRFLRLWFEVDVNKENYGCKQLVREETLVKRWFPYNKGGGYKKWYGYNEYMIDWYDDAAAIRAIKTAVIANYQYFMKPGLTWSTVTSGGFSLRKFGHGYIFDNGGCCVFELGSKANYILGVMNSIVFKFIFGQSNPTINSQSGEVAKFPVIIEQDNRIDTVVDENVAIAKMDWDSYETSWDFKRNPLVINSVPVVFGVEWGNRHFTRLSDHYDAWKRECNERFQQLKANEEELNRIFIDIYGLQDELTPEVADKDITVHRVFDTRDDVPESMRGSNYVRTLRDEIVSLISYAVGCMFGRYSLDVEGLAYAGGEFSDQWVVVSGQYYKREVVEQYVSKELQRACGMAEIHADGGGDLPTGAAAAQRGAICLIRPDAKGGSVDSVQYRRGASAKLYEGICQLPFDCAGVPGGTGNPAYDLCSPEILTAISNRTGDGLVQRGWADAERIDWAAIHQSLTTGHFSPDKDNIIPICDDEYFDDDITGRFVEFVRVVYGEDTLEENLKFVADALGGKGTPREVIRSYFLSEFYKDHCKTYQKRPIYWLFDSGKKNGFKALIYMHRYQRDLLARLRTDYVHEQQERYRTQLTQITDAMDHASGSERVKLIKQQKKLQEQALELQKYEEKIHHLADQNIEIDLDDGVKHNYALFEDVLAKIK